MFSVSWRYIKTSCSWIIRRFSSSRYHNTKVKWLNMLNWVSRKQLIFLFKLLCFYVIVQLINNLMRMLSLQWFSFTRIWDIAAYADHDNKKQTNLRRKMNCLFVTPWPCFIVSGGVNRVLLLAGWRDYFLSKFIIKFDELNSCSNMIIPSYDLHGLKTMRS